MYTIDEELVSACKETKLYLCNVTINKKKGKPGLNELVSAMGIQKREITST